MVLLRPILFFASFALLFASEARAQISESAVDERLEFLEQRLDADARHGTYWQWAWTGISAGGMISGIVLSTERDGDDQAEPIVNAATGAIGLAYALLRPMEARLGADPVRAMPATTLAEKQNKLLAAESLLERNAARARERTSWKIHLGSLAFNAAAFGFIAGFGNLGDAAISGGAGAVAGSLQLWSQPKRATADWEAYQALRNQTAAPDGRNWSIRATPGGVALRLTF